VLCLRGLHGCKIDLLRFLAGRRKTPLNHCFVVCVWFSYAASFSCLFYCMSGAYHVILLLCFWLSVPVQSIASKDLYPYVSVPLFINLKKVFMLCAKLVTRQLLSAYSFIILYRIRNDLLCGELYARPVTQLNSTY